MRITNKIIQTVVSELVAEEAVEVIMYLKGKENVSEFKIAKDLKLDIHLARAVLYKLFENSLASFIRKKDKQKGWYVCYWDYRSDKVEHLYAKIKQKKLEKLEERLGKEESSEFYMCRNACIRMDFDSAFGENFKCPECGQIMYPQDNSRTIEFLKERIQELQKEVMEA